MGLTQVSEKGIKDGEILNADINASAAIAGSKISPNFGSQNIHTNGNISASGNIDGTGYIQVTNATPSLYLTDSNNNPDYVLRNNGGQFIIRDDTAGATRLAVNTDGRVAVNGTYGAGQFNVTGESALGLDAKRQFLGISSDNDDMQIRATYYSGGAAGGAYPDIKFVTTDTERMRIAAGGNISITNSVGIGTASPSGRLHVNSGTDNTTLFIESTDGDVNLGMADNAGSCRLLQSSGDLHFRTGGNANAFGTGDSERMVIDSSGDVGIGTASPSARLHVNDGNGLLVERSTGTSIAGFKHSGASAMNVYFQNTGSTNHPYVGSDNQDLTLGTNNIERMRIDDHGVVRVGNTHDQVTSGNTKRIALGGKASIWGWASGQINGALTLADNYYWDGSNNKAIESDYSAYLSLRSGSMRFGTTANTQTGGNNISGGIHEKVRFQQGGGISFNGDSAAANALDDYEEGTWTPTLSFSSGGSGSTVGSVVCNYTKIGNLVHIKGRFTLQPGSSNGGDLRISGLPFTILNPSNDGNSAGIQVYVEGAATNIANDIAGLPLDNGTTFFVRKSGTTGSGLMGGDVDSGTTLLIGGCYQAA